MYILTVAFPPSRYLTKDYYSPVDCEGHYSHIAVTRLFY